MTEIKRHFDLPTGGSVTVTVRSPEPINEEDYFLLREAGAVGMAECLMNVAETMKPREVEGKP